MPPPHLRQAMVNYHCQPHQARKLLLKPDLGKISTLQI
jgi:hypothetical protein